MAVVIDTNVAVVANGKSPQAGVDCILNSIHSLREVHNSQVVLLDDRDMIFAEYRRHLSFAGQPGPGDAFFKWLWDNQGNEQHCRKIPITPNGPDDTDFAEFPNDPELAGFDRDDRVYVAVALASGEHPPILNASDTDWWNYREALKSHGVETRFLCPALMKRNR
jgi:hypothetical protein